jgi:hypothetical protein
MINDFSLSKGGSDINPGDQVDGGKGSYTMTAALFAPDTIDLGTDEVLSRMSGDFLIANPSIKLSYTNSFVDPIRVTINARGQRKTNTMNLNLAPFDINHPADSSAPAVNSVFVINRDNSSIDSLISMPPDKIYMSGKAVLTHTGKKGPEDINFSGPRSFVANLEVEVPLEFRMNNLQFTDTIDNFMKDSSTDNPFNPEDFEFLRIDVNADNGFPVGVSLSMVLYNSATHEHLFTVDGNDFLKAAPVDASGKVTAPVSSKTSILIPKAFWTSINDADGIIFVFSMKTTENGTKDVKIYSDYKINFTASLVLKPDIRFNLK